MRRLTSLVLLSLILCAGTAHAQTPRVVNGSDAADGEYPWTVALVDAGQTGFAGQFCGGTLVAPGVVVTAAHCVEPVSGERDADELEVLAGVTRLSAANDRTDPLVDALYHDVRRIAVHPLADVEGAVTRYDLAILTLADNATGVPVLPVATPAEWNALVGQTPATELEVAGWGLDETRASTDRLQHATIDLRTDDQCEAVWGPAFWPDDMLCALRVGVDGNGAEFGIDSCNGDSGGPLAKPGASATDPAGWLLVGAVSFGSELCDDPGAPGVYARIGAPALNDFVADAIDGDLTNDPRGKPEVTGAPVITGEAVVGGRLACGMGTATFTDGDPDRDDRLVDVELSVRRQGSTTSLGSTYSPRDSDVGRSFRCVARGTVAGAGGVATAMSGLSPAVAEAATISEPAPQQVVTVPVEVPVPVPVPAPPSMIPADETSPRVRGVSRRCTRRRSCTFTIGAVDPKPSAGVRTVHATLTSVVRRKCRRKGRRTTCTRVRTRTLKATKRADGTFSVAVKRLRKGRHTLSLVAVDRAGNLQSRPTRVRFKLR